jgi:hypothetical protein
MDRKIKSAELFKVTSTCFSGNVIVERLKFARETAGFHGSQSEYQCSKSNDDVMGIKDNIHNK